MNICVLIWKKFQTAKAFGISCTLPTSFPKDKIYLLTLYIDFGISQVCVILLRTSMVGADLEQRVCGSPAVVAWHVLNQSATTAQVSQRTNSSNNRKVKGGVKQHKNLAWESFSSTVKVAHCHVHSEISVCCNVPSYKLLPTPTPKIPLSIVNHRLSHWISVV
jgi:hypothetical protein